MTLKPPVGPNTPVNSGIADEGVDLPWRRRVNFVGSAVTATDDSANDQTIVTVTGGGAAGTAGGVLSGTYPNPTFAVDMATQAELDAKTYTFRTTHTFAIKGTVSSPDSTPSFYVSKASAESISLVKARYKEASGGNLTFKIQKNGSDLTGYGTTASPLTATTTVAQTASTQTLADDDELDLVIVGVASSSTDITVTLVIEHTV